MPGKAAQDGPSLGLCTQVGDLEKDPAPSFDLVQPDHRGYWETKQKLEYPFLYISQSVTLTFKQISYFKVSFEFKADFIMSLILGNTCSVSQSYIFMLVPKDMVS